MSLERISEKLKGYKTVIVNSAVSLVGLAVQFGLLGSEVGAAVSANLSEFYGALLTLIGVINVFLRSITDTPIGSSEPN